MRRVWFCKSLFVLFSSMERHDIVSFKIADWIRLQIRNSTTFKHTDTKCETSQSLTQPKTFSMIRHAQRQLKQTISFDVFYPLNVFPQNVYSQYFNHIRFNGT